MDPPRPSPSYRIVAAHNLRRTQTQFPQTLGVVEIAKPRVVRQLISCDRPEASGETRAALEDCRRPLREAAERFRDRTSRRVAKIQD